MTRNKRLTLILVFFGASLSGCTAVREMYVPVNQSKPRLETYPGATLETPPGFRAVAALRPTGQNLSLEMQFTLRSEFNLQFDGTRVTLEILPDRTVLSEQIANFREYIGKRHEATNVMTAPKHDGLAFFTNVSFSVARPARIRLHLPSYRLNGVPHVFPPIELELAYERHYVPLT